MQAFLAFGLIPIMSYLSHAKLDMKVNHKLMPVNSV